MFLSYVTHYIRRAGRCSFSTGCPFRTLPLRGSSSQIPTLTPRPYQLGQISVQCRFGKRSHVNPSVTFRHVQAPARRPFCPHPPCRIHRSHGFGREAQHRGVWLSTPQNSSSPSVLSPRQPSPVPFPFHAPLPKSPLVSACFASCACFSTSANKVAASRVLYPAISSATQSRCHC